MAQCISLLFRNVFFFLLAHAIADPQQKNLALVAEMLSGSSPMEIHLSDL